MIRKQDALDYHSSGRPGKIEISITKPCATQRDLSLAYTPGVADPCLDIHDNPDDAYRYTAKGNLVAVVSNGTAVLGLGDIGALAGKPVMEGKGVLFKRFADIDVFDIELNSQDPDEIIKIVTALEPTFGGINLEDIKAPECFHIEEECKKRMGIPVFHDDQHGTAIISGAALINALEIVDKKISEIKVVFNGAGAAGIACAKFYETLGVQRKNMIMCDTKGVIYKGRTTGMNSYKEYFAVETEKRTLAEAMEGADAFCGVSVKDAVTKEMIKSMNNNPIVFALANPDPEISYGDAISVREDIIMATGRSDYPNQVNNVLGFPFIFRGALDVRASAITDEMKVAASQALARLAKEDVPDSVIRAYGNKPIRFGREYIIPKPFDPRVLLWEAPAVAEAAMKCGVAKNPIKDLNAYRDCLEARFGRAKEVTRICIHKAQRDPKRIVFPEGSDERILRACQIVLDEKMAKPVLLGNYTEIHRKIKKLNLDLKDAEIIDPIKSEKAASYKPKLLKVQIQKKMSLQKAGILLKSNIDFGLMMVNEGNADCMIAGLTQHFPDIIQPALKIIKTKPGRSTIAGLHMIIMKKHIVFFADTVININPTAKQLADIAFLTAEEVKRFDIEPKIVFLSFKNFGEEKRPSSNKMQKAAEIFKSRFPKYMADKEIQADLTLTPEMITKMFPSNNLKEAANVMIFPDLASSTIAAKLMVKLGNAETLGPILMGMNKPVHLLPMNADVNDIVNMTAVAVMEAQEAK